MIKNIQNPMPQNSLSGIVSHSLSNWIKLQYFAEVFDSVTVYEPKKIFEMYIWKHKLCNFAIAF